MFASRQRQEAYEHSPEQTQAMPVLAEPRPPERYIGVSPCASTPGRSGCGRAVQKAEPAPTQALAG